MNSLGRLRDLAGIKDGISAKDVNELQSDFRQQLDEMIRKLDENEQIDEGFFTALRAALDVGKTAAVSAAKAATSATMDAYADSKGKIQRKKMIDVLTALSKDFEKFDTDKDLQDVLKKDAQTAKLLKSAASFLKSAITKQTQ